MRNIQCLLLSPALTAMVFSAPQQGRLLTQAEPDLVPKNIIGAKVRMHIRLPFELFINGQPWQGHTIGWHLQHPADNDSAIWLGLPGRGMYILSLNPPERFGFKKAGAIHGNLITFHDGGNAYEIRTSGRILESDEAWTLYLLHRSDMEMKGPLFGIDRLGSCTLRSLK